MNDAVINQFQTLSDDWKILGHYDEVLAGKAVNQTEARSVSHHGLRDPQNKEAIASHSDITEFVSRIHDGDLLGYTDMPFDTVVQIGIGGSELGVRAAYEALVPYATTQNGHLMEADFVGNIDPDGCAITLGSVDWDSTLFIIVSKSGNTLETQANLAYLKASLRDDGIDVDAYLKQHCVVITGNGSILDRPNTYLKTFSLSDSIGGRFSVMSPVGLVLLSLAFGSEIALSLLLGAAKMDQNAHAKDVKKNASLMAAFIAYWERVCLGYEAVAIVPYSESLRSFPFHLQQLLCESSGKSVTVDGKPIHTPTSRVVFGGAGTSLQHSTFQMLHQGPDTIPVQFIGFRNSVCSDSPDIHDKNHDALLQNLVAQMTALAVGNDSNDPRKRHDGHRPSSCIIAEALTPDVVGALFAFYENMVMFTGALFDINTYDQPGVEYGKLLAKDCEGSVSDTRLQAFLGLFT